MTDTTGRANELPAAAGAASAHDAGLRYAHDGEAGIRRRPRGSGFVYRHDDGRGVDATTRDRIRALVIPPAWTDVWIAPDARAHLQATGRDARRRKQYRYHAKWNAARGVAKYDHLRRFARALPTIRRRVTADLRAPALSRTWVLATVVRVLERGAIRVGNEEYRRANGSYGLTTLLDKHVVVHGSTVSLRFNAKSGVQQAVDIADPVLARHVRQCQELPGQTVFQYRDEHGDTHRIDSADVNAYLRDAGGADFTAKDFRTWTGTLTAARALDAAGGPLSTTARRREVIRALDEAAEALGNTRTVCRKCYVHPLIIERFLAGVTLSTFAAARRSPRSVAWQERALLVLLDERPARGAA